MKRAQYLGSAGILSVTQVLILVLFLGSYTDVVKGASLAPTPTISASSSTSGSGTGSMSGSQSGSFSQTSSQSISGSASATLSTSISAVTLSQTPSFGTSASPSGSLSFKASPSSTFTPNIVGRAVLTYYGQYAFPAGAPKSVVKEFFCGNSYEDVLLGEQCDYGKLNTPKLSCCTPQCQFANGGRPCQPRKSPCYKRGRCTSHGTCRGTVPKPRGKGCSSNGVKGSCDGRGNCNPGKTRRRAFYAFLRGKHVKKALEKRNLKIRQKHKDFNLDEIESQTKFNNNQLSSDKKLKRDQEVFDEIFDEDDISDDEENADDEATDQDDQEDLDEQEFD